MKNNKPISLAQLLKETKVVVPNIQRGYAQGRPNKSYVRTGILGSFKEALDKEDEVTLILDFVYGSRINKHFEPLDGQQRLTTLWLLHWYLAFTTSQNEKDTCFLNNFCYQTRNTSSEFCSNLCSMRSGKDFISTNKNLAEYVKDQVWYKAEFDTDPTIIGMLNTLGGNGGTQKDNICEIFGKDENKLNTYWDRLVRNNRICFYKQELTDNGLELTDDLYIKMNARGKQLTPFENFKADLLGLKDDEGEKLLTEEDASKLDNDWLDMFWDANPDSKSNNTNTLTRSQRTDRAYFKFINMYLLNKLMADSTKNNEVLDSPLFKALYNDNGDNYSSISIYEKVLKNHWIDLRNFLDNYKSFLDTEKGKEFSFKAPEIYNSKNASFTFTYAENEDEEGKKNLRRRIMAYGVCCYFENQQDFSNESWESNLKDWMHFLWNIVDCQALANDTQATMINVIRKLKDYGENSSDIVQHLSDEYGKIKNTTENEEELTAHQQFKEEQFKAYLAKKENNLYYKMYETAETLPYTRGSIGFLLKDSEGNYNCDEWGEKYETKRQVLLNLSSDRIEFTKSLWKLVTDWDTVFRSVIFFNTSDDCFRRNLNEEKFAIAVYNILSGTNVPEPKFTPNDFTNHTSVLDNVKGQLFEKLKNKSTGSDGNQYNEEEVIKKGSQWRFEERDNKIRFCRNYYRDQYFVEFDLQQQNESDKGNHIQQA